MPEYPIDPETIAECCDPDNVAHTQMFTEAAMKGDVPSVAVAADISFIKTPVA